MRAAMGIDFGTTNSTVCFYDGSRFRLADLEDGYHTIPSLLYIDKEYRPTYGEAARARFLSDNLNRQIKLEETDLGYIQITMGDGAFESYAHTGFAPVSTTFDARISAFTDQNLPGFLFASTKRLLGQESMSSVRFLDKNIKIEAVVSAILQNILSRAENETNGLVSSPVCVGRPVNFECALEESQEACNSLAISRMEKALEFAGVNAYEFLPEPVAPVLAYAHENAVRKQRTLLVMDFGGGTLDFSLLRRSANRLEVVDNLGRSLGGDIITERLIRDHIFPRLGLSERNLVTLRERHNHVSEMIPDILNWRTTYKLNQPKYFMQIAEAIRMLPHDAARLNRIRLLIIRNFSYHVFYAVEAAKKRLSEVENTEVDLEPIGMSFTMTRQDLEGSLRGYLDLVEASVVSFCRESGYETDDVEQVILTGGTSLIPCIRQSIGRLFPGRVEAIDPFTSVVKGFALGAWLRERERIHLDGDHLWIDLI